MSLQRHNSKKWWRIGIIVAGILLLLFLLRGPVRNGLALAYANLFFKSSVATQFDQTFNPVNSELAALGFGFADAKSPQTYKCHHPLYSGLATRIYCLKSQHSDAFTFTPEFVDKWKQHSAAFEAHLLAQGWRKEWDHNPSITAIYDNPGNDVSVGVHYSRVYGDILCELSVVYFASQPDRYKTAANERCSRTVNIFGGNSIADESRN